MRKVYCTSCSVILILLLIIQFHSVIYSVIEQRVFAEDVDEVQAPSPSLESSPVFDIDESLVNDNKNNPKSLSISSNPIRDLLEPSVNPTSLMQFTHLITIDMSRPPQATTATDFVMVEDTRNKKGDWTLKVSVSEKIQGEIPDDATTPEFGDGFTIEIPSKSLVNVSTSNVKKNINGEDNPKGINALAYLNPIDQEGTAVLSADEKSAKGTFSAQLDYTFMLPNYLPSGTVFNRLNQASEFNHIDNISDIGIFAGTYSFSIMYTIVSAP